MIFDNPQTNYEIKIPHPEKKDYSFPWRALMLSLMRISIAATCYCFGPTHNQVNVHGTIKEGRGVETMYKYYMYQHSHMTKPVLQMTLYGDPAYDVVTMLSASGLLFGILLDYLRRSRSPVHDGSGEMLSKRADIWDQMIFLLVVTGLSLSAIDLIDHVASLLYHTHLVMFNIGPVPACSFCVPGLTLFYLHLRLWLGAHSFSIDVRDALYLKSD